MFRNMRSLGVVLCVPAIAGMLSSCATCEPKPNLGLYKSRLIAWHEDGDYARCFADAARPAKARMENVVAHRKEGEKLALVLDVDETSLSNWPYLKSTGLNLDWATFAPWIEKEDGIVLQPVLDIYKAAREGGVDVFFITGRPDSLLKETEKELRKAGYEGWAGLYLKPDAYKNVTNVQFKSSIRKSLVRQGYRIVVNVGDQHSDLDGGYAEKAYKLPNPYYFVP